MQTSKLALAIPTMILLSSGCTLLGLGGGSGGGDGEDDTATTTDDGSSSAGDDGVDVTAEVSTEPGADATSSTNDDDDGASDHLPSAVAISVAAGRLHSCAVVEDGGVRCWGYAQRGQLGHGIMDEDPHSEPVEVIGIGAPAVAVSAFGDHTCALDDVGSTWCWGDNASGQVGDGSTGPTAVPRQVEGLPAAAAIAAGWEHTCIAAVDGSAWCWGKNEYGQLGNGSSASASRPVQVAGLSGAIAIATGRDHSCAATEDGTAWCWGGDTFGELGNDAETTASQVPVPVANISGVAGVSAGGNATCGWTDAGAVWCWGANDYGQLGDGNSGTFVESHYPVSVVGIDAGADVVGTGWSFTCAVVGGGARCWGSNYNGPLGTGEGPDVIHATPVDVLGMNSGVASIAAGTDHACALTDDGGVRCWGSNGAGEIGDGSTATATAPQPVISLP